MAKNDTYVLRIWQESQLSYPRRLSMENTRTGARVGFTDWNALVQFLEEQTYQTWNRQGVLYESPGYRE